MDNRDINIYDRVDIVIHGEDFSARPIDFHLDGNGVPYAASKYETTCPSCGGAIQFTEEETAKENGKMVVGCPPECGKYPVHIPHEDEEDQKVEIVEIREPEPEPEPVEPESPKQVEPEPEKPESVEKPEQKVEKKKIKKKTKKKEKPKILQNLITIEQEGQEVEVGVKREGPKEFPFHDPVNIGLFDPDKI